MQKGSELFLNDKKLVDKMFDVKKLYDGFIMRNEIKIPVNKDFNLYFDHWKDFQKRFLAL